MLFELLVRLQHGYVCYQIWYNSMIYFLCSDIVLQINRKPTVEFDGVLIVAMQVIYHLKLC